MFLQVLFIGSSFFKLTIENKQLQIYILTVGIQMTDTQWHETYFYSYFLVIKWLLWPDQLIWLEFWVRTLDHEVQGSNLGKGTSNFWSSSSSNMVYSQIIN